jgi:predicted phage-related endonuclease
MATLAFDTHAFVKELTQAGMPEAQAEVLARSQATLIDEKLATKQGLKELEVLLRRDLKDLEALLRRDLKDLEVRLTRDMKELEVRLTRDMKELELRLKHDLTLRLGSMMVVAVGVVAALVKLL